MGNHLPDINDTLNNAGKKPLVPMALPLECPWCGSCDNYRTHRKTWMRLLPNSKNNICLNCSNQFLSWGKLKNRKKASSS